MAPKAVVHFSDVDHNFGFGSNDFADYWCSSTEDLGQAWDDRCLAAHFVA